MYVIFIAEKYYFGHKMVLTANKMMKAGIFTNEPTAEFSGLNIEAAEKLKDGLMSLNSIYSIKNFLNNSKVNNYKFLKRSL